MFRYFAVAGGLLLFGCFPNVADAQRIRAGRGGVSIHIGGLSRGAVIPRLPPYGHAYGHRKHIHIATPTIVYRPVDVVVYRPLPIAVYETRRVDVIAAPRILPPVIEYFPPTPDDELIPVAPSVEELADQLRRASQLLKLSLQNRYPGQDDWLGYLRPNQIIAALDGRQPIDSLRDIQRRYDVVMHDPKYRAIHSIIGFQVTHQILSQFIAVALEPQLDVPPPVVSPVEPARAAHPVAPAHPVENFVPAVRQESPADEESPVVEQPEVIEELPPPQVPTSSI